jgi:putative ABC transport system substrate-binding protein
MVLDHTRPRHRYGFAVAAALLCLCVGCFRASLSSAADIAVLKSSDLAVYNQALEGFRAEAGRNAAPAQKLTEYNLEGDLERGRKLARRIRATDVDVVVTIGLKAALAAKLELPDTPVVFVMVLDPAKHELTGRNVTGILLDVPVERQMAGIRSMLPALTRLGVLYDPAKTSSTIEDARRTARSHGMELVAKVVSSEQDVPNAVRSLLPQVQGLWLIPDSTVLTEDSLKFMLSESLNRNVPVVGFSEEFVKSGALGSLSVASEDIGRQAWDLARRIAEKQLTLPMKPVPADRLRMTVNQNTAKYLGLQIPKEVVQRADRIY